MLDFGFYNMDCMEGMKKFPDKYFDLAIIDSPYGIKESLKCNKRPKLTRLYHTSDWDKNPPGKEYFKELFRVSKNQIIWGANHFISKMPVDSPGWIFWDKCRENQDFADGELAWTSFNRAVKKFVFAWDGFRQGYGFKNKEKRIHPTQKPVALYRWLLKNYANPGDIILDTHVGSASSLIACEMEGFKYVGFEIDKEYYDAAIKRLRLETKQQYIF